MKVVLFTGLPGTGKSTLAELVAKKLLVPVFAGDWLMGPLQHAAPTLAQVDRATYLELYPGMLTSLITRQLLLDQSALVDLSRFSEEGAITGSTLCTDGPGGRRRAKSRGGRTRDVDRRCKTDRRFAVRYRMTSPSR